MGKPDLGALIARTMAPAAEVRNIETITGEILDAKRTGGEAILTIGRCLIEAKGMLPHGEWKAWLEERVEFSQRTAQNFMRLAREFSNPQALADLGATKALVLLALPPEEREQFVAEHNVVDMTSRQLEQAIKERDEAKAKAEQAEAGRKAAEEDRDKLAEQMEALNGALRAARDCRESAEEEAHRLEQELEELRNRPVEVAVETVVDQEAIEKARSEAQAEMQAKLDKAKETAAKAKEKQKQAEAAVEVLKRSLVEREKAEKRAELAADEGMATFKVLFQQAQEIANQMRGILLKMRSRPDPAAAQGVEKALNALAEAIGRCVE